MNQPIKKEMNKPKAVGRMVQWAIALSQFDIQYKPWTTIKIQVLAYSIVEFTLSEDESMQDTSTLWTIHTDGTLVKKMGEVRVVITFPKGDILKCGVQVQFPATNNEA